jgi:hypothetical protein
MARKKGASANHRGDDGDARRASPAGQQNGLEATSESPAQQVRRDLPFHPAADMFPLLEGDDFDKLVADIKANGLREKIDLYEGKIIDGRNRYRALKQLGIEPDAGYFRKAIYTHTIGGETAPHEQSKDDFVRAYVISKNIHRRHLTAEQKRDLINLLIKANPSKSNRQIARETKADHKTVGDEREDMEARGEIPHVPTHKDSKGRNQAAKKPPKPPKPPTKKRTVEDFQKDIRAKQTAAPKEPPAPKPSAAPTKPEPPREVLAVDEEISLLREFAHFVIHVAKSVTCDPKDHAQWKILRERAKAVLRCEAVS